MPLGEDFVQMGQTFLEQLRELGDEELAMAVAGLEPQEVALIEREYEDFARLRRMARSGAQADFLRTIATAGKKGDVRAATWILERTNAKYAPPEKKIAMNLSADMAKMSDEELERIALGGGVVPALVSGDDATEDAETDEPDGAEG